MSLTPLQSARAPLNALRSLAFPAAVLSRSAANGIRRARSGHALLHAGRVVFEDVIKQFYQQTNKEFGTNYKPPQ